jgi:putative membrane protein
MLTTAISRIEPSFWRNRPLQAMLAVFLVAWAWSAIDPVYPADWWLENIMTFIVVIVLAATYRLFTFSDLSYLLIVVFLCLHVVGSHYTYSEVPIGDWAKDRLGLARNHYDRVVHFSYGLLWAYPFREVGLRGCGVPRAFASLTALALVLACSAGYEIIEWIVASIADPAAGQAYLGTQGDEFDGQKDMALAGLGGVLTLSVTALIRRRIDAARSRGTHGA